MPTQALRVGKSSQHALLRITEQPLDLLIQQSRLFLQFALAVTRQGLVEVLNHCSQPAHDLQIVGAAGAYFAERKVYKIIPIGRTDNRPQFARFVQDLVVA